MNNLFISLLIYSQNFIFSFLSKNSISFSIIEFLLIYTFILIISKTDRLKYIIIFMIQSIYFIHFSFISYFGRDIGSIDIYLFFTHINDTFESFFVFWNIFTTPFIITVLVLCLIFWIKIKGSKNHTLILTSIFIVLLFLLPKNIYDKNFILINKLINLPTLKHNYKFNTNTSTINPLKKSNINIVLVIGESLRAKEYLDTKLDTFEKYNYKTIYSGATNTDISIPLLLNGSNDPRFIDLSNNLFTLAKQNNFHTNFISSQSKKSLQYIKPFLEIKQIDYLNILNTKDDIYLLNEYKKISQISKYPKLIILQMQGSHSPYKYYPKYEKKSIKENYYENIKYTDSILVKLLNQIKKQKQPTLFIFTSDHGELIGKKRKYGHNVFEKEIYKVPLVIYSNTSLPINLDKVKSHFDIHSLIMWLLGYKELQSEAKLPIYINGTILSREDGFLKITN